MAMTAGSPPGPLRAGRWVGLDAYSAIAETLVRARTDAGLTQRDVAARLGRPPSYVAKVEQKHQRVDLVELVAYLRACGSDAERIVTHLVTTMPHAERE